MTMSVFYFANTISTGSSLIDSTNTDLLKELPYSNQAIISNSSIPYYPSVICKHRSTKYYKVIPVYY